MKPPAWSLENEATLLSAGPSLVLVDTIKSSATTLPVVTEVISGLQTSAVWTSMSAPKRARRAQRIRFTLTDQGPMDACWLPSTRDQGSPRSQSISTVETAFPSGMDCIQTDGNARCADPCEHYSVVDNE